MERFHKENREGSSRSTLTHSGLSGSAASKKVAGAENEEETGERDAADLLSKYCIVR